VIVCFCITSNDRDIATAIASGAHTVDQVGEQCGAGTGCGSCREFIQEMIEASGADCPGNGRCSECPRSSGRPVEKSPEPKYGGHSSLHAA
jgi:bacterioferritin-associated ferredoxin